jgi:hypothetical protein
MYYVTGLALVLGALIGGATGGRPRYLGHHRLRGWWLVVLGFGLQVAAGRLDAGSLGTVLALVGAAALVAFAALNPHLVGIGVVAAGVIANALVIGVNDGMPVRPSAVVAAQVATRAEEPFLGYGPRHHRETSQDTLAFLADNIPIPAFREVVSFGDLILAVGVADTIAHLLRPGGRHAGIAAPESGAGGDRGHNGTIAPPATAPAPPPAPFPPSDD